MFLLLKHQICSSSVTVKFLITELPNIRTHTILSAHMIDKNNEYPYYDNTIIKYMFRPISPNSKISPTHNILKDTQSSPQDLQPSKKYFVMTLTIIL